MNLIKKAIAFLCISSFLAIGYGHAQSGHLIKEPIHGIRPLNEPPPQGSHVYVFEVGSNGPNTAPHSLIACGQTGVSGPDSNGNCYVVTDSGGGFHLSGLYYPQCSADTSLVYLQALQGSIGSSFNYNPDIAFLSVMPVDCLTLTTEPAVYISDFTNVAAAYSVAPFANLTATPGDGFSTTTASMPALQAAFAASNALADGLTNSVISETDSKDLMNSIADIDDSCNNSNGGSGSDCGSLFSATTANFTPVDTWQVPLSIAENPTNNVDEIYDFAGGTGTPWQPGVGLVPSSWNIPILGGPVISGLSVSSGTVGSSLTISGSNLVDGSTTPIVVVGGVNATVTSSSSTSIAVTVPAGAITGFVGVYPGTYASNFLGFAITP